MGWDYWSLFNANSYIPTFGLFGGPGYIGGHRFDDNNVCIDDPSFTIEEALAIDPALNSSGETSQSDVSFKAHDFAYYQSKTVKQTKQRLFFRLISLYCKIYTLSFSHQVIVWIVRKLSMTCLRLDYLSPRLWF